MSNKRYPWLQQLKAAVLFVALGQKTHPASNLWRNYPDRATAEQAYASLQTLLQARATRGKEKP